MTASAPLQGRAAELVSRLQLQPHPEGGFYREVFRSALQVQPGDARPQRSALTTIDFLLVRGQCSAWHRVASDEVWHLLEGGPLRLWLMPPALDALHAVDLEAVDSHHAPRHVVPAHWWQAAEPLGELALVGATVGPGFDFADFAFLRADPPARSALERMHSDLLRLA
ncbi:cupin domain-containing protein [Piscinibacter sp. XHJ-5]|uniref:cupin domain-containing protein n=1 Tax=Piscinibacter sp. XHJ-5 TaxID=3037797 RepID=UPI00245304B6|nr:cupin domain-containing protein [Piscinibacter sp. XHJ-5]